MHFLLLFSALFVGQAFADFIVFTDRPQARFQSAAKLFEAQTGQKVVFVEEAFPMLAQRLEQGEKADAIITKDLAFLAQLNEKNLLQSLGDIKSLGRVSLAMKDSQLNWVALTYRLRTVIYNPNKVTDPRVLTTYDELASPQWQGRLCLRTAKSSYNEALMSQLMLAYGETRTRRMITGWVKNLAKDPLADDNSVINEIASGNCDVGIVNHYYYAMALAQNSSLSQLVKIAFMDQQDGGVHSNGMGIGIVKTSTQIPLAEQLIEILLSDSIQLEISAAHFDYPVVEGLLPNTLIKDWGPFKLSPIPWSDSGIVIPTARALMAELNYK